MNARQFQTLVYGLSVCVSAIKAYLIQAASGADSI